MSWRFLCNPCCIMACFHKRTPLHAKDSFSLLSNFCFLHYVLFWKCKIGVNDSLTLNFPCFKFKVSQFYCEIMGFFSKHSQSWNKSLINEDFLGLNWANINPWGFLFGPHCPWSILSRPQADILPAQPSCLVNN